MTLNGAIMQLVEIWNHPMCPVIFKPALNKVIETISELEEKLIETISEPEEPCAQVLGESCEIEQYVETCEECGFCDTISRQQAGKALEAEHKKLKEMQSKVGTNLAEEYARAVRNWLVNYQVKCADLAGRYTPYEVLGWIVSDWRKENGIW